MPGNHEAIPSQTLIDINLRTRRVFNNMSTILGINAFHAGASAAIIIDGTPIAAVAEERLNRVKYFARFPAEAIKFCLDLAGIDWQDIDYVAIGRDASKNKFQKYSYALSHPEDWSKILKMKLNAEARSIRTVRELICELCGASDEKLRFETINVEHHLAHIASSYFASTWEHCAGFSIDGSGDFVTCMLAECQGSEINILRRVFMPNSLGIFYTAIGQLVGYSSYGDEGKVMGLAPLGTDKFIEQLADKIELNKQGFVINPRYFKAFGAEQDDLAINDAGQMEIQPHYRQSLIDEFGPPRKYGEEFTQREMDMAYAVQHHFERAYLHMLNLLHEKVPSNKVSIAGGCALNSVANGKVFTDTPFNSTCIMPAAGDDGLAIGAALYLSNSILKEGNRWSISNAYLGPGFDENQARGALDANGVTYDRYKPEQLVQEIAVELEKGNVVGWFQGRMEWGPRALGNRSILAHPGLPDMKETLNARVKGREWFRPFAPAILAEKQTDVFEQSHPSPFMLHVYKIKPEWRERLPAVCHVDHTGRLQSVSREENPLYYDLISAFYQRTGIPIILNTSFNENEPIVCRPEEAIDCFLRTKMDVLALGPFVCRK